eukprot:g18200.t1
MSSGPSGPPTKRTRTYESSISGMSGVVPEAGAGSSSSNMPPGLEGPNHAEVEWMEEQVGVNFTNVMSNGAEEEVPGPPADTEEDTPYDEGGFQSGSASSGAVNAIGRNTYVPSIGNQGTVAVRPPGTVMAMPTAANYGPVSNMQQGGVPAFVQQHGLPSVYDHAIAGTVIRRTTMLAEQGQQIGDQVSQMLQQGEQNFNQFSAQQMAAADRTFAETNARVAMQGQTLQQVSEQIRLMQQSQNVINQQQGGPTAGMSADMMQRIAERVVQLQQQNAQPAVSAGVSIAVPLKGAQRSTEESAKPVRLQPSARNKCGLRNDFDDRTTTVSHGAKTLLADPSRERYPDVNAGDVVGASVTDAWGHTSVATRCNLSCNLRSSDHLLWEADRRCSRRFNYLQILVLDLPWEADRRCSRRFNYL